MLDLRICNNRVSRGFIIRNTKFDFILSATGRSHLSESRMSQHMQQTGPYPRRFHSRLRELAG